MMLKEAGKYLRADVCKAFGVVSSTQGGLFDGPKFQSLLQTQTFGRHFIYHEEVDSTMTVAVNEIQKGAQHGTVIVADRQTQGRGRRGRHWSTSEGNISTTIIYHASVIEDLYKLNFATPIAVVLASKDEDPDIPAKIKWPNDVWIEGKKVSGMLLDSSVQGRDIWASIGVGVNLNQEFANSEIEELRSTATSLSEVLKRKISREGFLAHFCKHLEDLSKKEMKEVMAIYSKYDLLCGNTVLVMPKGREGGEVVEAEALRFSDNGSLVVKYPDGKVQELYAEEVSIRLSS